MTRLLSISSSRADVGILQPVWRAAAPESDLHVLLTGMHCAATAGEIETPKSANFHRGGTGLAGATASEAARAMAAVGTATAACLDTVDPDAVLVVGDRLDMLPAATATVPYNVPLVHLHGGEITEGALDDRVRHAITKLAHLHCVSSEGARRRLIAMGEAEARIHLTGAPGLDTLRAAPEMTAADFADALGMRDIAGLRLVTVHPETNAKQPLAALEAVLAALDAEPLPTLFTAPNSDPGGARVRAQISDFVEQRRWASFTESLGSRLYPNALRHAALMLGNSSSGLIEAGLFGLPVIDVGDRQGGREYGANVTRVANDATSIKAVLAGLGARPERRALVSLYGDGRSGPRVAEAWRAAAEEPGLMRKPAPVIDLPALEASSC
jgi:UDP-hydrolysing UDP-N-acetyl-D-glucosamine 2-epimerase